MYNEINKNIIDGQVCLGLPIYNNVRNRIHYGNIKKRLETLLSKTR